MIIIADDKIPYLKGIPEQFATVKYLPVKEFTPENIKNADVLIVRTPNKCTADLLRNSRVKFIASTTIGFDHIDVNYCDEMGIKWTNCPGCNAISVAQYILASLIELARKESFDLKAKTLGIVGVGNVGKEVEKVYNAYGLDYLLCDPIRALSEGKNRFVDLSVIAEECDIISFHVPLTRGGEYPTYHLANRDFFNSLKNQPYFINVARGAVHDTQALIEASENGLIKGMVIDCWEHEPAISIQLLHKTLIATPHIAGFSADGKANGTRMCMDAIAREYGIRLKDTATLIAPDSPQNPIINLDLFSTNRIDNAILSTFSPMPEDSRMRKSPEKFEYLRTHYNNPREFHAYQVINASEAEQEILGKLGFQI